MRRRFVALAALVALLCLAPVSALADVERADKRRRHPGGRGAPRRSAGSWKTFANGAAAISQPRSLNLVSVTDNHDHAQFAGDGTAAHPTLYDRDVLAPSLPGSNWRAAIGVYVATATS